MAYLMCTLITGVGATLVIDLWAVARRKLIGAPPPNYALVGRWLAGMTHGRFHHDSIAAAPVVAGERVLGWSAHYLIGVVFAGLLLGVCGLEWILDPTITPALLLGVATVAAPLLIMQPAMGAGVAASRTPRPGAARLQSLLTHTIFGLGLYGAAFIARLFYPLAS